MMNIKSEYEKLKKKYNLPEYEELDENFELLYFQQIAEIKYPLRFVRRRILDKINAFIGLLQNIINPNPVSLISLEESKFFSEAEKNEVILLVKDMMKLEREGLIVDIKSSEKNEAEFIKEAYKIWKNYRERVYEISKKLRDGWQTEIKGEEKEKTGSIFG